MLLKCLLFVLLSGLAGFIIINAIFLIIDILNPPEEFEEE